MVRLQNKNGGFWWIETVEVYIDKVTQLSSTVQHCLARQQFGGIIKPSTLIQSTIVSPELLVIPTIIHKNLLPS